jgi:hypothetical protein
MFSFHRHFKAPYAHFIVTSFSLSLFYFVSSHFSVFILEVFTGRAWFSPWKKRAGPGGAGPGLACRPDCNRTGPGLNTTGPTIELTKTGRAGPDPAGLSDGRAGWGRA